MGLAWFGNPDWDDERPPTQPVECYCTQCGWLGVWHKPLGYEGTSTKARRECEKGNVPKGCLKCGGKCKTGSPGSTA